MIIFYAIDITMNTSNKTILQEIESTKAEFAEYQLSHKKLGFGKYKDLTLEELVRTDAEYALWVTGILKDEKAREWVLLHTPVKPKRSIGQYRINFGKHAAETYDWLLENDPDYAKWLVDKIRSKKIREYVRKHLDLEPEILSVSYEDEYPSLGNNQSDTSLLTPTRTCCNL